MSASVAAAAEASYSLMPTWCRRVDVDGDLADGHGAGAVRVNDDTMLLVAVVAGAPELTDSQFCRRTWPTRRCSSAASAAR